jgi:hypothetical protein
MTKDEIMLDNIPIFRAKSRTTDLYEYGHLFKSQKATFIIPICEYNEEIGEFDFIKVFEPIFEDTIAIHFPNMLASDSDRYFSNGEKDLRIFASLQEDGKGGDILFDMEYKFTLIFDGLKFRLEGLECNTEISDYDKFTNFDNIGIQK